MLFWGLELSSMLIVMFMGTIMITKRESRIQLVFRAILEDVFECFQYSNFLVYIFFSSVFSGLISNILRADDK